MHKGRLEAFSDGVLAILITILVLELKIPHGHELDALTPLLPVIASYVLSFVYIGIYWNNHHHLLQAMAKVDGKIMWANMHLLFWLSLVPFTTGWMGESHFARVPTAAYGGVLLAAALAFTILVRVIIAGEGKDSKVAKAVGDDRKGLVSLVLYTAGIAAAFVSTVVSGALYVSVALIWLVPDRRIEKQILP
ncbi:MAG: hypothetical protein JWM74_167 [Myxococcaceae bacterium]|nr:hypothetical protein [Myxococcaceae bacterium]